MKYSIAVCGGLGVFVLLLRGLFPLPLALQDIKALTLHVEDCSIASEALWAAVLWREPYGSPEERLREKGDFRASTLVDLQDNTFKVVWSNT